MLSFQVVNLIHELSATSYPSPANSHLLTYNMMRMEHHWQLLDTKPGYDTLAPILPLRVSFGIMRQKIFPTNAASHGMENLAPIKQGNVSNSLSPLTYPLQLLPGPPTISDLNLEV